jgi:D-3-phosphoglycerate dehydrogenase
MYKILICDPLSETVMNILKEAPDVEFHESFGLNEDDLCEKIKPYNAVIVRSATQITAKVIEHGENLKVIGRAGTGLDNIDVDFANTKGIKILNTPGTNAPAVAELTIGLMFSLARSIPYADKSMKDGKWIKKEMTGIEISGKTLGIIGFGQIGKLVAKKALALDMDVLVCNRSKIAKGRYEQVPMEKLLEKSDFVSIHLPKSPETHNMIGLSELKLMKSSAYIINTSRGGMISEKDLQEALKQNIIAGAALDVFENEPDYNKDLTAHSRVVATPHIGAASAESQERVGVSILDQILEFLRTKYIFIS